MHHGPDWLAAAVETIKRLLGEAESVGLDIDTRNEEDRTAFEEALSEGGEDGQVIEAFRLAGLNLPRTALPRAAESCNGANSEKLDVVLSSSYNSRCVPSEDEKFIVEAICTSAFLGSVPALESLHKHSSTARFFAFKDEHGATAAHSAADGGQREVLRWLQQHGALCYSEDEVGRSPLGYAIQSNSRECIAFLANAPEAPLLIERGPLAGISVLYFGLRSNTRNGGCGLAYLLASDLEAGQKRFPRLHCSAVLNAAVATTGDTLLHVAAGRGDYDAVFSLLRAGAAMARNHRGMYPLDVAQQRLGQVGTEMVEKREAFFMRSLEAIIAQLASPGYSSGEAQPC